MTGVADALREELEAAGYEIDGVAENRRLVRVTLRDADASAAALRDLAESVAGDDLLGVTVSAERAGGDAVGTVLSVRHR